MLNNVDPIRQLKKIAIYWCPEKSVWHFTNPETEEKMYIHDSHILGECVLYYNLRGFYVILY